MAIQYTVEDGTGLAGANAYSTLAQLAQYAENRNRLDAWDLLDDEVKQAASIVATQYMQARWSGQWKGYPASGTQALDWPRIAVVNERWELVSSTSVPAEVLSAHAEYTLIEALGDGLFYEPAADATGRPLKSIREKVDVIEEAREFLDTPHVEAFKRFPIADMLLRRYLRSTSERFLNRA